MVKGHFLLKPKLFLVIVKYAFHFVKTDFNAYMNVTDLLLSKNCDSISCDITRANRHHCETLLICS